MAQIEELKAMQAQPYRVFAYNHRDDSWSEHMLPTPDAKALQAISIAIGIRVDKVLQLMRFDEKDNGAARAAILDLMDTLREDGEKGAKS